MRLYVDKIGSFGAVLAAAACPVCFPKLAALAAIFGFGAFGAYEGQLFFAAKVLVLISPAWSARAALTCLSAFD